METQQINFTDQFSYTGRICFALISLKKKWHIRKNDKFPFLMRFLFSRKSLLIWREGCTRVPYQQDLMSQQHRSWRMEQWYSIDEKIHHLLFFLCFSFSGFSFSLYMWAISCSVINDTGPVKFMSFSQYKIASDKGILHLSNTTLTITDPAQWSSPSSGNHSSVIIINDF